MSASFFQRAVFVAAIAGFLSVGHGLGFTSQARAETFKVGTYNIHIAGVFSNGGWGIVDWENTRRYLVYDAIVASQPDIMGFQEAFARSIVSDPSQKTQQVLLGEVFDNTKYRFYTWEVVSDYNPTASENNWNPIIVNTERFTPVAAGSRTVNFETYFGSAGWDDYHRLHEIFHDPDHDPNDTNFSAHSLTQYRYINWVVVDDKLTGGRVAFLTSHYETFIGSNEYDPLAENAEYGMNYGDLFDVFSDTVNDSFGYASREIDAQAEELRTLYGDLGVVIGGDFETGDSRLPAQQAFTDADYIETWRADPDNDGDLRATMGIDVMFVQPDEFVVDDSDYDWMNYSNEGGSIRASDHKPLYADLTQTDVPEPGDISLDGVVDREDVVGMLRHLGAPNSKWRTGDFDGDRQTGISDLAILQAQLGLPPNVGSSAVPEPSGLVLGLIGAAFFARRRRSVRGSIE